MGILSSEMKPEDALEELKHLPRYDFTVSSTGSVLRKLTFGDHQKITLCITLLLLTAA